MSLLRRYSTALSRRHRSAGHGIHSPFAYDFVKGVLCQRLPYYAYPALAAMRREAINRQRSHWPHPRIISLKNAKLLFRLANFFEPSVFAQIGTNYGITATALLAPDSRTRLCLYEPDAARLDAARTTLEPLMTRISLHDGLDAVRARYDELRADSLPFVVINDIASPDDARALTAWLTDAVGDNAVVVCRNIQRRPAVARVWQHICEAMTYGQTYTNDKIGIAVALQRLQREHFYLWF